MKLAIYRPQASDTAVQLARILRDDFGVPARKVSRPRAIKPGDAVVCYGSQLPVHHGAVQFNNVPIRDKKEELLVLARAGVPAVEVCEDDDCNRLTLIRDVRHQGGGDLLYREQRSGRTYRTHKENFAHELRIHIWDGKSMRVGIKAPAVEAPFYHLWIRSHQAGWDILYGDRARRVVRQSHRDIARQAVNALGLKFAAVDVGVRQDGTAMVIEVNRAPGLDGQTLDRYAARMYEWYVDTVNEMR